MKLTLYQQMLLKLHQATDGDEKKEIDFVALVRKEGFGGSLDNILDVMGREGWIVEGRTTGSAQITHWGNQEVARINSATEPATADAQQLAAQKAQRAAEEAQALAELIAGYAADLAKPKLPKQAKDNYLAAVAKLNALKNSLTAINRWKD